MTERDALPKVKSLAIRPPRRKRSGHAPEQFFASTAGPLS